MLSQVLVYSQEYNRAVVKISSRAYATLQILSPTVPRFADVIANGPSHGLAFINLTQQTEFSASVVGAFDCLDEAAHIANSEMTLEVDPSAANYSA